MAQEYDDIPVESGLNGVQPPYSQRFSVVRTGRSYVSKAYQDLSMTALYQLAFGYVGTPYVQADFENYIPTRRMSLEGQPIIAPLKLDGVQFPHEPMVTVNGAKKVIETDIDGRSGTFKESWRLDDYTVTINGVIVNEEDPDEYPFDQVRSIRQLCEKMTSSSVDEHQLLADVWGIPYLAIYSWEFPEVIGMPNVAKYSIRAKSDFLYESDFEVEIT